MTNDRKTIDLIETALDREPFCACGEPTTIVAHPGEIRLECQTLSAARGSVGRLVDLILSPTHVSHVVVDGELAGLAA